MSAAPPARARAIMEYNLAILYCRIKHRGLLCMRQMRVQANPTTIVSLHPVANRCNLALPTVRAKSIVKWFKAVLRGKPTKTSHKRPPLSSSINQCTTSRTLRYKSKELVPPSRLIRAGRKAVWRCPKKWSFSRRQAAHSFLGPRGSQWSIKIRIRLSGRKSARVTMSSPNCSISYPEEPKF